jgi:hypothetical protein
MATTPSILRGIRDIKIAAWGPAENTWGPAYDIYAGRGANLQWVVTTDTLRGDDTDVDVFTNLASATLTINHGSIDLTVFNMLMGGTLTQTAAYYDFYVPSAVDVPYVGIAGRVSGSGGKDIHFLLPKCKLASNLQLNAQVDAYLIPQWDVHGVNEGTINGMLRLRQFLVPTALTIPLATTGGGG